jgi:hypothetical protein
MKINEIEKRIILSKLASIFGSKASRTDIINYFKNNNEKIPNWLINGNSFKLERGIINLYVPSDTKLQTLEPVSKEMPVMLTNVVALPKKKVVQEIENLVPSKDETYVPFGFFRDLKSIIKSKSFYPLFITGLSGNGKTTMVEQVCAELSRECIRVNISLETDEDDLIGGNTLVNGNVIFREGPVVTAMRLGAILLVDEIDRGSNKLMCMQGILEGKSYFVKKTGEVITPTEGFNIIATANTKGRGTEDGRFIAAQILDEAFLERFPITIEQEYPLPNVERKIIINNMEKHNCIDEEFADKLVTWAEIIRKTYMEGAIDELISTRRLVHIVKAFSVFNDRQKAINLCINRFDADTKNAFLDLYTKMDMPKEEKQEESNNDTRENEEVPF